MKHWLSNAPAIGLWLLASPLMAATYAVGPGLGYTNLQAVAPLIKPGDLVEVAGGVTYRGDVRLNNHGVKDAPITIRGLRIQGRRPVFAGVAGGEAAVIRISGDYYLLETIEVTAAGDTNATRGIRNVGHGSILRDVAVYDCPRHGILNSDAAGSLTLENVEVYRCGYGEPFHQVYIGMDNAAHPEAVFRMRFCHIHDGKGGNNVKTRAGRNEIYYNWIEDAWGRELELLGPDRRGQPMNKAGQHRADSDVVGNVISKLGGADVSPIRVGGDGSGTSHGRVRFVNNTILMNPRFKDATVFKLQDDFETLEVHNNVFYRLGQPVRMFYDPGLSYQTSGANNWIPRGSTHVPKAWQGTLYGLNPGFRDVAAFDLRPATNSPLRNAGQLPTKSPAGWEFSNPLSAPVFQPRRISHNAIVAASAGPVVDGIDIGAFKGDAKE
jgi:hypothetical protein